MAEEKNKVEIKITADDGATVKISRVKESVKNFRDGVLSATRSVGKWILAFSRINWIVSSVQTVVALFRGIHEWMNRAATAARELARELERESIATAAAHAAEAYKKLNKELAETNRLEKERNDILAGRKAKSRDIEDAALERDKELEISRLDPNSKNYDRDKREIEQRYARRSSEVAAARADEDVRDERSRLFAEAESKDREANRLQAEYDKQIKIADRTEARVREFGRDDRRGVEGAKEKHDEAEREWKEQFAAAQKVKEAMEAARNTAESLRRRAGELMGGDAAARIRNEALERRIANEESAEKAREKRREDDRAAELAKEREISKLDPRSKTYERDKKEIERKYEIQKAEREAGVRSEGERGTGNGERPEPPKPVVRGQEPEGSTGNSAQTTELEIVRQRIENERREEAAKDEEAKAKKNREEAKKNLDVFSRMEDAAISSDAVSQNRLTAMGLGSGVSASGSGVIDDLRKIQDLLKQQIEATKDIEAGETRLGE